MSAAKIPKRFLTSIGASLSSAVVLFSTTAVFGQGTLDARFIESAPKDRFEIRNQTQCNLSDFILSIDLGPSAGNLIFDTEATGLGVEVFQPLEIVRGSSFLKQVPQVKDGDQRLDLNFSNFPIGESFSFTIDADDQKMNSSLGQIRVTDSEMEGALVIFKSQKISTSNGFESNSRASLALTKCPS